jgi:DNA replication and repair protein RecF
VTATFRAPAVTRLTLTDFRNYAALRLDLWAGSVVLTGANGAGKTNLLEALSMLQPGRGLRGAALADMARRGGGGGWAVAARIEASRQEATALGTEWQPTQGGEEAGQRRAVIDGEPAASVSAFARHLTLLWLTPAMDRLFTGPPGDRRRYLDRLVASLDPDHPSHVGAYERAMRDRNLLLAEAAPDRTWLDALEARMAESAAAIAAARLSALDILSRHTHMEGREGAFPWARLSVSGELESALRTAPSVHAEEAFRKRLGEARRADAAAGRALSGPHRSDLEVVFGPKDMPAALCSTGEQKALLVGLVLAQASAIGTHRAVSPVLLLDEIAAHFDERRREALFGMLAERSAQAWLTGTDPGLFEGLGKAAQFFHVDTGIVHSMKRS